MTKADLLKVVSEESGVTQKDINLVMDSLFGTIEKETLKSGRMAIPNFGIFTKHVSPARVGRNPQNGEPINIAEKTTIKFKKSK